MSDLNETKVRRLDFMLLLVLREGVRRRKLADVAAMLGVTQTAISHSVARLRDIFEDELFIRRPHGVEPTTRAVELARMAERIIETVEAMLTDPATFDPATVDRDLRVCALDFEVTLLSGVIEGLRRQAPGLRIHFKGLGREAAVAALDRDEADLWIGFARALPATMERTTLFDETYKLIARSGHPRLTADAPVTLDAYCAEQHVVAAPGGTAGGIVDTVLHAEGRARVVAVTTTGFLSALDLVSRTDLIATVPARLATAQAANFGLLVADPPLALRPFAVSAAWHRRTSGDPAVAWVVDRVRAALT
jgi:DNA-binding transcriptional LysR family regulator